MGFSVTLISHISNEYTFNVTSSGEQTSALTAIKFRFGDQQTINSPSDGSTFTATRTLLNGVEVTLLELKTPAIAIGKQLAKASSKISYPVKAESAAEWIIPIKVASTDGILIDSYNGLGVKTSASTAFDLNDTRNFAPNLDTYVDIYFPHHESDDRLNYWPQKPMKASFDIRSEADVIAWDFRVDYRNASSRELLLSWDSSQFSTTKELTLVDFQAVEPERINMLTNASYVITTPANDNGTLYFAVVAADPEGGSGIKADEPKKPSDFYLLRSYPNPFNATTTIQYNVQNVGKTSLKIYSVTGALVRTLVESNLQPAEYQIQWDGRDEAGVPVATGLYICQLRSGNAVSAIKIALIE